MFFPIRLSTSQDSIFVLIINIPLFASFRLGFAELTSSSPTKTEGIKIIHAYKKNCLHFYVLGFRIRVRSKACLDGLVGQPNRVLLSFHQGWTQAFSSAII